MSFPCGWCPQWFLTRQGIRDHVKAKHAAEYDPSVMIETQCWKRYDERVHQTSLNILHRQLKQDDTDDASNSEGTTAEDHR